MTGRDKVFGAFMCIVAILIALGWFWILYMGAFVLWAIEIVVTLEVLVVLGIMFWIGWTIMSTPTIQEVEKAAKRKR